MIVDYTKELREQLRGAVLFYLYSYKHMTQDESRHASLSKIKDRASKLYANDHEYRKVSVLLLDAIDTILVGSITDRDDKKN